MAGATIVAGILLCLGLVYWGITYVDSVQKDQSGLREVAAIEAKRKQADLEHARQIQQDQEEVDEKRRAKLRNYLSLTICEGNDEVAGELALALDAVAQEANDAFASGTLPDDVTGFMETRLIKRMSENALLRKWFGSRSPSQFARAIYGFRPKQEAEPGNGTVPSFLASNKYASMGSGFLISPDGWILTNQHVVHSDSEVEVRTSKGDFRSAKVVKTDSREDLALLKIEGAPASNCLSLEPSDSAMGTGVFTIGFPKPSIQGVEPKFTDGRISSLSGIRDDSHTYQISVPVQPGNSGGPLVNMKSGLVTGMISSKLASNDPESAPENVNYAIKQSIIRTFLKSVPALGFRDNAIHPMPAIGENAYIENVKASVVLVLRRRS